MGAGRLGFLLFRDVLSLLNFLLIISNKHTIQEGKHGNVGPNTQKHLRSRLRFSEDVTSESRSRGEAVVLNHGFPDKGSWTFWSSPLGRTFVYS